MDFYHGLEHLEEVSKLLWEKADPEFKKHRGRWIKSLLKDGVERVIARARAVAANRPNAQEVEKALGYFERNKERMRYGSFRGQGLFIGSGVIEAGCKTVVGSRCKQSGMFWSTPGAEHVLAFRCIHQSRRIEAFWKDHLNNLAARNDSLHLAA